MMNLNEGYEVDINEFQPQRGDVFKCLNQKGDYTHIVYLATVQRQGKPWAIWAQGDKPKMIELETFLKPLEWGDHEFLGNVKDPDISQRVDVERLAFFGIAMSSLGAGVSGEQYLESLQKQYEQMGKNPGIIIDDSGKAMNKGL